MRLTQRISNLTCPQTQFEAWLALQAGSSSGLMEAPAARQRWSVTCLHNASKGAEDEKLRQMWRSITPSQAYALLSKPDVTVTNQSDKEVQLQKIERLDEQVRAVYSPEPCKMLYEEQGLQSAALYDRGFSQAVVVQALTAAGVVASTMSNKLMQKLGFADADSALACVHLDANGKGLGPADALAISWLCAASAELTSVWTPAHEPTPLP